MIARFFKEIGWADELGSGVRKMFKYSLAYGGSNPELQEADIFRFVLPLSDVVDIEITPVGTSGQATEQATEQAEKLLAYCKEPKSREEMQEFLNLKHREHFRAEILKPLLENGLLSLTIPDKPTSPKQKYYAAPRGEEK